jgi:hypothetical protein
MLRIVLALTAITATRWLRRIITPTPMSCSIEYFAADDVVRDRLFSR